MIYKTGDLGWVEAEIGDCLAITKLRSAEKNAVFKIQTKKGDYVLKQGPGLERERDRLLWLDGRLPVPKVTGWQKKDSGDELLMTYVEGHDLAHLIKKIDGNTVVNVLADALHLVHKTDISDCPFGEKKENSVFVHGDACLPNFIFKEGKLNGIIDLADAGIGTVETDLSAAVWSLNFNLGPSLGVTFLRAYGAKIATEEYVERLIERYETEKC